MWDTEYDFFALMFSFLCCLIVQQILSICFSKIIGYTLFEMTKNG